MGYPRNSLQCGNRAEWAVFSTIAHDPAGECRSDHWQRREFIHAGEVEIHGRPGPCRSALASVRRWRLDVAKILARCRMIARIECDADGIEVEAAVPVCLARITGARVDWCGLPGARFRRARDGRNPGRLRLCGIRSARHTGLSLGTAHRDRRIDGFDLPRERGAIAGELGGVMRMKLAPAAHGNAERRDRGEEDEGAAFTGGRHARNVCAGASRSVTDSLRESAVLRRAALDISAVAWQTQPNSSQHGA